jgi:phage-related tail fiber protein
VQFGEVNSWLSYAKRGFAALHLAATSPSRMDKTIDTPKGCVNIGPMKIATPRALPFFVVAFTICHSAAGQDQCVALLRHGLYNTYRSTSGNSSLTSAKSDFCNAYSQFKQSGQSASLEASYKVFSGSASYSQQNVESLASQACGSSSSYSQADAALDTLSQVIDGGAIDAYEKCVEAGKVGLMYKIIPSEVSANTISVEVYYQQKGTPTSQRIDKVTISQDNGISKNQSVQCAGTLFDRGNQVGGVTLTSEVLSMVCTRSGANTSAGAFPFLNRQVYAAPVTIAVHTNMGIIQAELSTLPVTPAPPPPVFTPVGSVVAFAGEKEPDGWLICDGRLLSRSGYPELFGAIGTRHGHGDAVTTFNLPDYRGRFLRGADAGAGVDPGDQRTAPKPGGATGSSVGSIQADSFLNHTHSLSITGGLIAQNGVANIAPGFSQGGWFGPNTGYGSVKAEQSGGTETRPKNSAVTFLIRVR